MKRKRYSEAKIVSILKEHEAGAPAADLSRRHGVTENSIYRWKAKYGGMEVSDAKRLRELEAKNRKLSRALPNTIICDNGPGFTSKAMYFWSKHAGVKLHFIQPGKPTQNAFVESFNGKMGEYCLDLHWFASIGDARSTIGNWQRHNNPVRLHRSLGKKPPAVFAKEAA